MLGFGSSVCGRREQLQGAQPRSPSAGLAARRLRCSGREDVQLSVYSPCDLHSTQPAQPLAHVMSFNHPSLLQTGKEATTLVSSQVTSGGRGLGPGSFLWTCHLVSRDLGLSSERVTWCPGTWVITLGVSPGVHGHHGVLHVSMEGAGAEVGAAAAGDSGCQPAGPIGQDPASLVGQHGKVF